MENWKSTEIKEKVFYLHVLFNPLTFRSGEGF